MDHAHTARPHYTKEMSELEDEVLDMASRAEEMVKEAVDALVGLDADLAHKVMEADDKVDVLEIEIEQRCLRLLALQQPMASDLREIGTVIKIITDIERIGDLAVDVAKIALKVEKELGHSEIVDIPKMASVARHMLRTSIQMFVKKDAGPLSDVARMEEEVDDLYRALRGQVFAYMIKNTHEVVSAGWLLLAIHHIERMADHALNIAERCQFMVTGGVAIHEQTGHEPSAPGA